MWGKWEALLRSIFTLLVVTGFSAQADVICRVRFQNGANQNEKRVLINFSEPVNGFTQKKIKTSNGTLEFLGAKLQDQKSARPARETNSAASFEAIIRPVFPRKADKVKVTVRVPESVVRGRSKSDNAPCEGTISMVRAIVAPTATATATPTATNTDASRRPEPPPPVEPTSTATAIATATATNTSTTTNTVPPTATRTVATPTRTSIPTATNTAAGPTSTPRPTSTNTPRPASTNTPVPTSTNTPRPPATSTPSQPSGSCPSSYNVSSVSLPTFPKAEGHGRFTVGGSGRHLMQPCTTVMHVTNLKDSGTGSLRSCVEASGPRTCVFDVGGPIWSTRELVIKNPLITIAGQTAPSPGIMIRGSGISVQASDVVIQHLQMRIGDDARASCCASQSCSAVEAQFCTADPGSRDGIRIYSATAALSNVVIDHVSIAWALDEGFSISPDKGEVANVTFSNSIITSGLDMSIHPEASIPSDPGHSKGVLINGSSKVRGLSFVKNFLAHNADRNIRISTPITMEYINNIIYDWGRGRGAGRTIELTNSVTATHAIDLISNLYLPGPDTFCPGTQYRPELCVDRPNGIDTPEYQAKMHYILRVGSGVSSGLSVLSRYYLKENYGPTRGAAGMDEWAAADKTFFANVASSVLLYPTNRASGPVAGSNGVAIATTDNLVGMIASNVGSRPKARDTVDDTAIQDLLTRQGRIINCVQNDGSARCAKNAGGWPFYPATERVFAVPANPNADDDGDGYTNLEEALIAAANALEG